MARLPTTSLAASLRAKALSDLGLAQRMATRAPSGHGLATAMCHGQQSLEKMLKSTLVLVYEGARLGDGEAVARRLGHPIYPRIAQLVYSCVAGVEAPHFTPDGMSRPASGAGAAGTVHAAQAYGQIAETWGCFAGSSPLQGLAWKASMGVADSAELSELASWFDCRRKAIEGITGKAAAGRPMPKNPMPVPPNMERAVRDRGRIERLQLACGRAPESAERRELLSRGHAQIMALLGPRMRESHDASLEPYDKFTRRSALEFWFQSIMSYHGSYMFVFPHNTLGRYPTDVGCGLHTTDLYMRQLDHVLYHLFVHVPCLVGELMSNYERFERVLERGKSAGCW